MTKTTKRLMKQVRRRLTVTLGKHMSACGYDELVQQAITCELDLLDFVENAIESLARKAGVE